MRHPLLLLFGGNQNFDPSLLPSLVLWLEAKAGYLYQRDASGAISNVTSNGVITITTSAAHGMTAGSSVLLNGSITPVLSGSGTTFTVAYGSYTGTPTTWRDATLTATAGDPIGLWLSRQDTLAALALPYGSQQTAASRPTLYVDGSGRWRVRGNGVSAWMGVALASAELIGFYVATAATFNSVSGTQYLFESQSGTNGTPLLSVICAYGSSFGRLRTDDGNLVDTSGIATGTEDLVFDFVWDGTTQTFAVDGGNAQSHGHSGAVLCSGQGLFASGYPALDSAFMMSGDIIGHVFCTSAVSTAQQAKVRTYLAALQGRSL